MPRDNSINRAGYLRESFHYFHLRDSAGQVCGRAFIIFISGTAPGRSWTSTFTSLTSW